jgi:cis-3-alkyl-4-acyloxetan-2-one decarboxylase
VVKQVPEQLREAYPWKGEWLDVDGGRMHYLDVGPRGAPAILCVHGNPTWSFYWRHLVKAFSDRYRVIVPDHIGCGMSDKPQDWPYRLEGHVGNLCRLVGHLGLERLCLAVHDWGGAIGMGFAVRNPEIPRGFLITNTAAFRSKEIPLSIASCRIPLFGAMAVRGFNAFAGAATWRATSKGLSSSARAGLLWPYDSWENRIATLRFVEDIPLEPGHPSYGTLLGVEEGLAAFSGHPMLICWGDQDFCFTPSFRAEWERRFPRAEVHAWQDVGHYVMEDAPERIEERFSGWLGRLPNFTG